MCAYFLPALLKVLHAGLHDYMRAAILHAVIGLFGSKHYNHWHQALDRFIKHLFTF